jgi:hypothetical protein
MAIVRALLRSHSLVRCRSQMNAAQRAAEEKRRVQDEARRLEAEKAAEAKRADEEKARQRAVRLLGSVTSLTCLRHGCLHSL